MAYWCLYCDGIYFVPDQEYRGYVMVGGPFAESSLGLVGSFYLNFTWGQSNQLKSLGACIVIMSGRAKMVLGIHALEAVWQMVIPSECGTLIFMRMLMTVEQTLVLEL